MSMRTASLVIAVIGSAILAASPAAGYETALPFDEPQAPPAGSAPATTPEPVNDFDAQIRASKSNMMSDPAIALDAARAAEDFARTAPPSTEQNVSIATAYWLQAEALTRLARPETARPVIERALALIGDEGMKTKLGADLLLARARNANKLGDDETALKDYHAAHDVYADLGITRSQALCLQGLGSIYQAARDYQSVLEYYERAAEVHPGDPALDLSSFNNLANAHRELGNTDSAIELFTKALDVAQEMDSPLLQSRIIVNIANTHIDAGNYDLALRAANDAISMIDGQDLPEWRPLVIGVKGQVFGAMGQAESAAAVFDEIFAGLNLEETRPPFRDFHEAAYEVYSDLGYHDIAIAHLEAFKRLDDAGRDIAASTNTVLAKAEFDFTAQQLEIEKLTSEQLRRQNELQRTKARARMMQLLGLAGFVVLVSIALAAGLIMTRRSNAKIAKANQELEETNVALDRANRVKTEFLATTSHEIRTPLNGVLGLTQVMLAGNDLNNQQRDYVEQIRGAGDTLLAVVNDILDVATIESGKFEVTESVTDVGKLAREVIGIFKEPAETKGLRLTLDSGDCPAAIMSDTLRLRQVIFNLVSNAVKFTETGGVHVALSIQTNRDGEFLSIKVNDTGIGIPEDQLDAIFETFHQLDSGRTRRFGGTGLGLSICQRIAWALGGDIAVTSRVGQGSRFNVMLPLKRLEEKPKPRMTTIAAGQIKELSQLDVLVVEDNLLNSTVIRALLEKRVRSVTLTGDGVQALAAMKEKHFHLVLMDKQMPNMDGLTATRTIRSMTNGDEQVYIIAVTADAYDGAREELLAAGCDDYLSKPVSAEGLIEAIERAMERGLCHVPEAEAA